MHSPSCPSPSCRWSTSPSVRSSAMFTPSLSSSVLPTSCVFFSLPFTSSIHCHFSSLDEVLTTHQIEPPSLSMLYHPSDSSDADNTIDGFDVFQKSIRLGIGGGKRLPRSLLADPGEVFIITDFSSYLASSCSSYPSTGRTK